MGWTLHIEVLQENTNIDLERNKTFFNSNSHCRYYDWLQRKTNFCQMAPKWTENHYLSVILWFQTFKMAKMPPKCIYDFCFLKTFYPNHIMLELKFLNLFFLFNATASLFRLPNSSDKQIAVFSDFTTLLWNAPRWMNQIDINNGYSMCGMY